MGPRAGLDLCSRPRRHRESMIPKLSTLQRFAILTLSRPEENHGSHVQHDNEVEKCCDTIVCNAGFMSAAKRRARPAYCGMSHLWRGAVWESCGGHAAELCIAEMKTDNQKIYPA